MKTILALLTSAALLALGIPQIRDRLRDFAKNFAICRIGMAVKFHHDPFAMVNIANSTTTYQKFCGRCNTTLATGNIPPEEQAIVDKVLALMAATPSIDMGLALPEQSDIWH